MNGFNRIFQVLAILAGTVFSAGAKAVPPAVSIGTCSIEAKVELTSVHWFWGGSGGEGTGQIHCSYTDGSEETLPITVNVWGFGWGFGASSSDVAIVAHDVKITGHRMRGLLGEYATARVGAEVGPLGKGKVFEFKATREKKVIPLTMTVIGGGGFEIAANVGGIELEAQ